MSCFNCRSSQVSHRILVADEEFFTCTSCTVHMQALRIEAL
jgi:hypothetical protein